MATIYFYVESKTVGENLTFLETGPDAQEALEDAAKVRGETAVPIGPEFLELIEATLRSARASNLVPAGVRIPRELGIPTTADMAGRIRRLTGAVDFFISAHTHIVIPADVLDAAEAIDMDAVEEGGFDRGEKVDRARRAVRRDPEVPRALVDRVAILKAYKLYGKPVDDIDDLLGFEFNPAAVAAAAVRVPRDDSASDEEAEPAPRGIPRAPFKRFEVGATENCLVEGLIAKYSGRAVGAVAAKSIRNWFAEANGGPSLYRLEEFAERYGIPLRVYVVTGKELKTLHKQCKGGTTNRPGLAVMAFGGHAYIYSGDLPSLKRLERQETDIEGFSDTRVAKKKVAGEAKDFTDDERKVLEECLAVGHPNFNWKAEEDVCVTSFMMGSATSHICAEKAEKLTPAEAARRCGCARVCWDMNAAFHTASVMVGGAGCPPPLVKYITGQRIPIFTPMDDYKTPPSEFPKRDKWDITYFFLTSEALEALRAAPGHGAARTVNILTGMEFAYLFDRKLVGVESIAGWKTAKYGVPADAFAKWIVSLDKGLEGPPTRGMFALLDGLLGRVRARVHRVHFVTHNSLDVDLLRLAHPPGPSEDAESERVRADKLCDEKYLINVAAGKRRYRSLNTRNFYHHVIGRTNLVMMAAIDEVARLNGGITPNKITIDAAGYDRAVELPPWMAKIFKPEVPRVYRRFYSAKCSDPAELQAKVDAEIAAVVERCEVITGAPGTGKTYEVMHNHKYDRAMAFSNICARNLDTDTVKGETLHAGLGLTSPKLREEKKHSLRGKTLWVDEFSTVHSWIWTALNDLLENGLERLILTGDPNQTPPVGEEFRADSRYMAALLGKAKVLTKDHRNDEPLIALRESIMRFNLAGDGAGALGAIGAAAKAPGVDIEKSSPEALAAIDVHITFTNEYRHAVNRHVITTRGLRWDVEVAAAPTPQNADETALQWTASAGLRLRALRTRKANGIAKGSFFVLAADVASGAKTFDLRRCTLDAEDEAAREAAESDIVAAARAAEAEAKKAAEAAAAVAKAKRAVAAKAGKAAAGRAKESAESAERRAAAAAAAAAAAVAETETAVTGIRDRATITLPMEMFDDFGLGYAITAHSSIGQTVRGQKMAIHEVEKMVGTDPRALYVAVTRACKLLDVALGLGRFKMAPEVSARAAKDAETEKRKPKTEGDDAPKRIFDASQAAWVG